MWATLAERSRLCTVSPTPPRRSPSLRHRPWAGFCKALAGKSRRKSALQLADFEEFHLASEESAAGGQTEAPEAEDDTDHHFISFVEKGGDIYELDGAKTCPVNHGAVGGGLLEAAARVIKAEFIDVQDAGNIHFNIMALVRQG